MDDYKRLIISSNKRVYFYNDLKSYRELANLSQKQLASCCGCSRQSIISIERGYFYPSTRLSLLIVSALSEIVNCDFNDVFWVQDDKNQFGDSVLYRPDVLEGSIFLDEELDL